LFFFESHVPDADLGVNVGAGLWSRARGIKKLSPSPPPASADTCETPEYLLLRYVVVGRVKPSLFVVSVDVR